MCPIANLSDIVRMPRLGKIHLGVKVEAPGKNPYPRATDYFVCPPEVQEVFGPKPKELPIMFPVDTVEQFAQQWYRAYTRTQGLVCVGDGEVCRRKVDMDTGALASHVTIEGRWEWTEDLPCDPQECPEYATKSCRRVMNLQFLLPDVPGLGVWQIDTTSFYSIVNINSMIKMLKGMLGRCSMIPLTLVLGPVEVSPAGLKKKTVFIMHINKNIKLADMARLAQLPPARALIPEPEAEEPPEDLYPKEVLEAAESTRKQKAKPAKAQPAPVIEGTAEDLFPEEAVAEPKPGKYGPVTTDMPDIAAEQAFTPPEPEAKPKRDPESIKNIAQLYSVCFEDFKLQPKVVLKELGYGSQTDIAETPAECYRKIAAVRE